MSQTTKTVLGVVALMLAVSCTNDGQQGTTEDRTKTDSAVGAGKTRDQRIVVVSYGGGAYQQSHLDAFVRPFTSERGVQTESVVWGAEYGRLVEMVRSRRVPWDVVEVTAAQFTRGLSDSIYQPLTRLPPQASFAPLPGSPGADRYGVPSVYWSTVLAYRKQQYASTPPRTWADFWDVRRFPGDRALYDNPRGTLEFALLADGVPMDSLYPLDVDRAFRKLESIRPHVRLWWSDGAQPVSALLSGRIAMSTAWSGRIFASPQARREIGYSWDGAVHELDYWVIPRGSRYPAVASDFILFASTPERMARQAALTAYGPANSRALSLVPDSIQPHLPTAPSNWNVSFVVNSDWWAQNEQQVMERWLTWRSR